MAVSRQGDVPVTDLSLAGLPAPSLIRAAKIATIDAADATKLGKVSAASLRKQLPSTQIRGHAKVRIERTTA